MATSLGGGESLWPHGALSRNLHFSCHGRWAEEIATRQGPPGGAGGPHLQMLLLPGEGVGQPLRGLGSVLCHLGLDGVRDFLEHGVDLFQEAPGFMNVVQLQMRPDGQSVSLPSRGPGGLSSAGPRRSHPTEMAQPGNSKPGQARPPLSPPRILDKP